MSVLRSAMSGELEILRNFIPNKCDGIIIDAGAYTGITSAIISATFPDAKNIAVEASSNNFRMLQINAKRRENIESIHAALFSQSGKTTALSDRGTREWGFLIVPYAENTIDGRRAEDVITISLEEIMSSRSGQNIMILKLDIEGAEMELFRDASAQIRKIPIITAELHEKIVPGCEAAFYEFSKDRKVIVLEGEKILSIKIK